MANPIVSMGEPPDRSPSGVLRHRDLDTLLALTHLWIVQGQKPSGEVICELHELFRWMGYNSDLTSAPYAELRASIHRLSACRVLIFHDSDRDEVLQNRPRFDFTLLSDLSSTRQPRPGSPALMTAHINPQIIDWMQEKCQAIDMDIYAHLVRHPATRRCPLARVIWVALTRHRQADRTIRFRAGWLANRYADRRKITSEGFGSLVYTNAFSEKSRLGRAIAGLGKAGALGIRPSGDGDDWMEGKFLLPSHLPRLRDEPRQNRLFRIDTMAIAEAAARGEPPPTPQFIEHQVVESIAPWWLPGIPGLTAANANATIEANGLGDHDAEALAIWVWWSQTRGLDGAGEANAAQRWKVRAKAGREAWNQTTVRQQIAQTNHYASGDPLKQAAREMRAALQPRNV
jgi:hypothetical protein